jgi:hypothetical protein
LLWIVALETDESNMSTFAPKFGFVCEVAGNRTNNMPKLIAKHQNLDWQVEFMLERVVLLNHTLQPTKIELVLKRGRNNHQICRLHQFSITPSTNSTRLCQQAANQIQCEAEDEFGFIIHLTICFKVCCQRTL